MKRRERLDVMMAWKAADWKLAQTQQGETHGSSSS